MKKPYKIAIMQLSRVGDIMMMLPLTRALKRTYPGCHITMIVREKYKSALDLFDMINDVVTLKTQDVLQPYLENESDVQQTLDKIEGFIGEVKEKQIDWLINLSFSPVSADFTHAVTQNTNTSFSGYSRYPDGYIQFSDTVAEYFFNEVGTSRSNQIHLTEIFAKMTRTQLIEEDFVCPNFDCAFLPEQNSRYYTIHLGASEEFKRAPFIVIQKSMEKIQDLDPEIAFCFIGTSDESALSVQAIASLPERLKTKCINLCGQTNLKQLLHVMGMSYGHLGGDSLPVQLAMLSKTKVFLLSAEGTNFFETGPLTEKSIVYRFQEDEEIQNRLPGLIHCFVTGQQTVVSDPIFYPQLGLIKFTNFQPTSAHHKESLHQLSCYLYFNDELPLIHDATFVAGIQHLNESHSLVLEHIQLGIQRPEMINTLQAISRQVDAISEEIAKYGDHLAKVCQWIALQKSQIAPQSMDKMLKASVLVYESILGKMIELQSLGVPMSYDNQKITFKETS